MRAGHVLSTLFVVECIGAFAPWRNQRTVAPLKHHLVSLQNDSWGLTDDGDFAILGINYYDTASSNNKNDDKNTIPSENPLGGFLLQQLTGGVSSLVGTSSNVPISSPMEHFNRVPSSGSSNQMPVHSSSTNIDPFQLEEMEEWLLEIIPTLKELDLELYATGLLSIGFDPDCVTQSEIRMEDLLFMKILHRRYFFNEITGVDHPWDA
jgi:hypothetical protein